MAPVTSVGGGSLGLVELLPQPSLIVMTQPASSASAASSVNSRRVGNDDCSNEPARLDIAPSLLFVFDAARTRMMMMASLRHEPRVRVESDSLVLSPLLYALQSLFGATHDSTTLRIFRAASRVDPQKRIHMDELSRPQSANRGQRSSDRRRSVAQRLTSQSTARTTIRARICAAECHLLPLSSRTPATRAGTVDVSRRGPSRILSGACRLHPKAPWHTPELAVPALANGKEKTHATCTQRLRHDGGR